MTDLHTHILPGMDDGAADEEVSLQMLRQEMLQGVDTVVLTPHFYREQETASSFLQRRACSHQRLLQRLSKLPKEEQEALPRMLLGAEVRFTPNLAELEDLTQLCMEGTDYLLLEMPFYPWNAQLLRKLYELVGRSGVTPVLAHIERYLSCQKKELLQELLSMGLPVQMGTELLLASGMVRRQGLKLLKKRQAHFVASDCHDTNRRPPNLGKAVAVVRAKLGEALCSEVLAQADELVYL